MPIEKWSDSIIVVHVADDPLFCEEIGSAERMIPPCSAVLDFAAVSYVNSSCIAKLLRLRSQIVSNDLRLVLCNLSEQILGAMQVTGLDKIFEVSENVPTALATIQMSKPRAKKAVKS
jgi:anti-anti-sigma factor